MCGLLYVKLPAPYRVPQWAPYRVPICGHPMGTHMCTTFRAIYFLRGHTPWCSHISLGSTSLNYCPFGAGIVCMRWVGGGRGGGRMHSHHMMAKLSATLRGPKWAPYRAPISQFHFMIYFSFAGSFGPSNGHPIGHPCGYPIGHPLFSK